MKCIDVRMDLVAYLDGELSGMGQQAIEVHLEECDFCAREVQELRDVIETAQHWNDITPRTSWREELSEKLAAEKTKDLATEIHYLRNTLDDFSERLERREANAATSHEIMTLEEVTDYLRVDADVLWNMLDELPHFQIGYELRFKKSSIDEWIRFSENRPETTVEPGFSGNNWFEQLDFIRRREL